jgi:hypothetical protein
MAFATENCAVYSETSRANCALLVWLACAISAVRANWESVSLIEFRALAASTRGSQDRNGLAEAVKTPRRRHGVLFARLPDSTIVARFSYTCVAHLRTINQKCNPLVLLKHNT